MKFERLAMESLLRWGIANSAPQDGTQPPPQPRTDLDPGIIDAILGKSDAELMKEALAVAVDETRDEDDRVQALDDFEMVSSFSYRSRSSCSNMLRSSSSRLITRTVSTLARRVRLPPAHLIA